MKLKSKINKIIKSYYLPIIFVGLLFLFHPFIAAAAGGQNTLDISPSAPDGTIGKSVQITVSLKSSQLQYVSASTSFSISAKNTTTGKDVSVSPASSVGPTASISVVIRQPDFNNGNNTVQFTMQHTTVTATGAVFDTFIGTANFNIQAGATSGDPTVSISNSITSRLSNVSIIETFPITYSAGGSSRKPTNYNYDCGNGDNGKVSDVNNPTFDCKFPATAGSHNVTVTVSDGAGSIIPTVNYSFVVSSADLQSTVDNSLANSGVADALIKFLNEVIAFVLGLLQEFIYLVFSLLVAPLISALLQIHVYQDSFVAVIYAGWEVVRNLCNIFFIVALIIIAMATLFRVDSYKYKDLLVQLIIAALMVNFSLVIAQAILAIADTVQAQFLSSNVDVVRALAGDLMLRSNSTVINYFNGTQSVNGSAVNSSIFGGIIQSLFWVALSLGTLCVFLAIAAFLLIRIVMLWLLLMVSPVAYVTGVLPSTSHYREEWWTTFLKYAFFTPIMAFFLNMASLMATNAQTNKVLQLAAGNSNLTSTAGLANFVVNVSSNILILIFLIVALKVADSASIYGASGITSLAQKGIFAPFAVVGGAGKLAKGYVGRRWNEATSKLRGDPNKKVSLRNAVAFAALNPVAWVKGMKYQSEERTHRAQAEAEAVGKEVAEQRFSDLLSPKAFIKGSYKINPHVFQHAKHDEDEQAKNLSNLTLQEVVKRAYEIALMPDTQEGRAYKRGVIKLTMSKGHIDDITENMHTTEEGKQMMKKFDEMIAKGWFGKEDVFQGAINPATNNWQYTHTNSDGSLDFVDEDHREVITQNDISRRAMYVAMFGGNMHKGKDSKGNETLDFHLADHEADRLITQEGETEGLAVGHLEYMDMKYDPEKGHYESYKLVKQDEIIDGKPTGRKMWVNTGSAEKQAVEIAKRNPRDQMSHLSPHALMSSDGKTYHLATWKKVSTGAAEAPQHIPDRLADRVVAGWLPQEVVDKIRKDLQVSHEAIVSAYGPTTKSSLGTTVNGVKQPDSAALRIKLNDDDRLRLEAFAAENRRGVAGLFQKFLKNDGALQNALVDGKYEIEVESPNGSLHKIKLKG